MLQLRLLAGFFAGACLVSSLSAHDGDPKLRDKQPMYVGPGWRNAQRIGSDGGVVDVTPPVSFPSNGVTLLAWLSLSDLGVTGAGNGNSCFGYTSPSGREYAIIGLSNGTAFVEVTQPGNPVIVEHIAAVVSLWRDVKTYQNYCYTVSEGGGGIQVINLANIDAGVVTLVGTVNDDIYSATHTLAINPQSGYLYRSGGSNMQGDTLGLRIYNLNTNPASPQRVGSWADRYVHEPSVFSFTSGPAAGREIAYCCGGLNGGFMSTGLYVVDVTNKASPTLLKYVSYANSAYAHQVWLSPDRQWIYLDDELDDEELGITSVTRVFNNANPLNVTFANTFTNGSTAIDHNLYTAGTRIFQASYRAGLRIFSTSNPGTPTVPVEVGFFDTWPGDNHARFNGMWNNYPYLPSGIVLGSDIEKGLFVWWVGTPQIAFAFPSGAPTTFSPNGASFAVQLNESSPGLLQAGTAKLHYDAGAGWVSVDLVAAGGNNYTAPLPATACNNSVEYYLSAQSTNGVLWSDPPGAPNNVYTAVAAASQTVVTTYDFEVAQGWTAGVAGDTATTGVWVRVNPNGNEMSPEDDHSNPGSSCYVTDQNTGELGDDDVDGGKTTLLSPTLNLANTAGPVISYWRWYQNHALQNVSGDDVFRVDVSNNNGSSWTNVETIGPGGPDTVGEWRYHEFRVADFVAPTAQVRVRFVAEDASPGTLVEAAIDDVRVLQTTCPAGGTITPYCFGDGSLATACPCGNVGQSGRGCENSATTGGALLTSTGGTSPDTVVMTSSGEIATSTSIFLQGDGNSPAGAVFGDGVRCVAGSLKRLYVKTAVGGTVTAPAGGDPSITARSAALGDTIAPGSTRYYQVYYRDANLAFCAAPPGDSWNVGNGLSIVW